MVVCRGLLTLLLLLSWDAKSAEKLPWIDLISPSLMKIEKNKLFFLEGRFLFFNWREKKNSEKFFNSVEEGWEIHLVIIQFSFST